MLKEIIFAGFGGQGVLTTGIMTATVANAADMHVTWFPSYGSEMRGGTANCSVKISDKSIGSPYVKELDILFSMNEPAIDKFESMIKPGGYIFVNSSLVDEGREYRKDINVIKLPVNNLATQVGNPKGANIVMLGAMVKTTNIFTFEIFKSAMCDFFENKGKGKFNKKNVEAFEAGYKQV